MTVRMASVKPNEGKTYRTKEFVSSPIDYSLFDENYSSPLKLIEYLEEVL